MHESAHTSRAVQGTRRLVDATRNPLLRLVVRRVVASVFVLFLVSILVFLLIHIAPGGPENALLGRDATEAQREAVRERYHLNNPLLSQYGSYLRSLLRFDLGNSYILREPVTTVVWRAAWKVTIPLLCMTMLLATTIGVGLGYVAARLRGSMLDRTIIGFTVLGASTPVFATGMLVAYVFGVRLGWFPFFGSGDGGLDTLWHLVLPAVATTAFLVASTTKLSRARFAEILDEDYVTFAQARGLSPRYVVGRVLMRNAAVQIVTWSGSLVVALVGGLVIVERVFSLNGVGTQLIESINARDVPVVQGITLMIAVLAIVVNLVVDLLCMAIDPRIRRGVEIER
jgi:ABC-type dipeptide/oligopeptide/nickel transport system permease component